MIICTRQLGKELGGSCEKQMVDHARMYFFKTLYSVSSLLFFLSSLQNIYNKISEEINSFLFSFFFPSSCVSVTSTMNLRNLTKIKTRHHMIPVEDENFHSLLKF